MPSRYLDHNATSPLCPAARAAWLEAAERWPGNASSPHRLGGRAGHALEEAREELASLLGCPPGDLVWTSGATESNNAILHHLASAAAADGGADGVDGAEAWISAIEHPSMAVPAARCFGSRLRRWPVTADGVVDLEWLERALSGRLPDVPPRPAVVACMAANNETGVLQPWEAVAALCRGHGVPYVCDAAQWLGKMPARGVGGDGWLTGCAHKFGGPPGVGFLRVSAGAGRKGPFRPWLVGGPQEDGRRAGTENLPGIRAAVAALRDREEALRATPPASRAADRDRFEERLLREVPGVAVAGSGAPRLWNTSALLLPVVDCRRRWVVQLDREGFAVSTGSACSSGKEAPSPVLAAMGLDTRGDRLIRVSSGWETPSGDWEELAATIGRLARAAGGAA